MVIPHSLKIRPLIYLQVLHVLAVFYILVILSIIPTLRQQHDGITTFFVNKFLDENDDNLEEFGDNEINATKSRKFVSAREYYCFKLQVRKKLFNIILFGGRLFQQWAVDMYIKIETMRLDWYSWPENQKVICADLYQVTCFC